jgi:hypothetical protein
MKREGAMKHQKILQDHFSHKVKPISVTQLSPGAHYDAAAPRSPVPSPASVGSTGSAGSGTEQLTSVHHSTHHCKILNSKSSQPRYCQVLLCRQACNIHIARSVTLTCTMSVMVFMVIAWRPSNQFNKTNVLYHSTLQAVAGYATRTPSLPRV